MRVDNLQRKVAAARSEEMVGVILEREAKEEERARKRYA
jgi:hypothetical protein